MGCVPLYVALPHRQHRPPGLAQVSRRGPVPLDVVAELALPELHVAFRLALDAGVPVPEAAVHEHRDARVPVHEVRLAPQDADVALEPLYPAAEGRQRLCHLELGLGVLSLYGAHYLGALLLANVVHRPPPSLWPPCRTSRPGPRCCGPRGSTPSSRQPGPCAWRSARTGTGLCTCRPRASSSPP